MGEVKKKKREVKLKTTRSEKLEVKVTLQSHRIYSIRVYTHSQRWKTAETIQHTFTTQIQTKTQKKKKERNREKKKFFLERKKYI